MEPKSKNSFQRVLLILIAAGVWTIVFQNAGVIPTSQKVEVTNNIRGSVEVDNTVDVNGSVSVDNEVDVNISSVNGHQAKSYGNGHLGVSVY